MKALNTIATMAFFLVNCATVDGQSRQHYKQNPYTLVYEGAIMIAGSRADTKYMTDAAFSKVTKAKSKELYIIDAATHIQTYWKPEYVTQAVNKLTNFYKANL